MPRWVAAGLVLLAVARFAHAEPYIAARTGLGCASCHLNRTGGGGRTPYGAGYGAQTLPWKKLAPSHGLFDGAVGERVRLGFDARGGYLGTFRDEGPYIGEAKLEEANAYLAVDLLKDRLAVYLDMHAAPGSVAAREAFALVSFDRAGLYVKGGKFFQPFGLRFQDDEASTRRATGFTFETADIGAEGGLDTGSWSTALSTSDPLAAATQKNAARNLPSRGMPTFCSAIGT